MDDDFVRNKLFRPFETTKGNAGMGIGVYETREFIKSMKGRVTVKSQLNIGTTFTIKIPLELDKQDLEENPEVNSEATL
jgi:signal transduction histidine kinase